jgi:16S rRNA processing protein RimM
MSQSTVIPRIVVGHISGPHGVHGWLRIQSYTEPMENILHYSPWYVELAGKSEPREVQEGRLAGKGLIVSLKGCADRDAALALQGATISIERAQLPPASPGEVYWHDLIGLEVRDLHGHVLGTVRSLMETGANDVLVVVPAGGDEEILIPYIRDQVVREVDLESGCLRVDWDPDY